MNLLLIIMSKLDKNIKKLMKCEYLLEEEVFELCN